MIARFRAWSNGNGTDDGQNSNRDFFINNMVLTSPTEAGVATNSDFVIITRQPGAGAPVIADIQPAPGGVGLQFGVNASINGATYAIWASPTLFPSQQWQAVTGTEQTGTGGDIDLSITNDLLPTNFYRIGYTP